LKETFSTEVITSSTLIFIILFISLIKFSTNISGAEAPDVTPILLEFLIFSIAVNPNLNEYSFLLSNPSIMHFHVKAKLISSTILLR